MTNYNRTFTELESQMRRFEKLKEFLENKNTRVKKFIKATGENDELTNSFKLIVGSIYFQMQVVEVLSKFRSNRYFNDAIGIGLLPELSKVQYFFKLWNDLTNLKKEDLESLIDDFINNENYLEKKCKVDFEFLNRNGYLIVPNVIDEVLCDEVNQLVIEIAKYEKNNLKKGYLYGNAGMQRVYSLISKAKVFRDILLSPIIDQVMKHMFYRETFHDKYYLTSFHANLLEPKSSSQIWHIDANVPEPIPPWIIRFNTNYITQEYTKEGGSTEVIPGSHLWNRKPNAEEAEKGIPEAESVFLEASKGSIAFWHGHLWHRSGENKTEITRVALLGAYTASHLREVSLEENPYRNLNINIIEDLSDELKRVIGWDHGAKYYY